MTTHLTRRAILKKRFGNFWATFKRSRRGIVGSTIVTAFIIFALVGPYMTPYDSTQPKWQGYYPAGPPILADYLCMPAWYKQLPGGGGMSENMKVISNHEFSTENTLTEWKTEINDTALITGPTYNPQKGTLNEGCIEFSYKREPEIGRKVTAAKFSYDFRYPFTSPPRRFWIHFSHLPVGTISPSTKVLMEISFYRTDPARLTEYTYPEDLISQKDSKFIYTYPIDTISIERPADFYAHTWIRSSNPSLQKDPIKYYYYEQAERIIFPAPGDYTFEIELIVDDAGGSASEVKVYLDNLQVLLYGEVFGLLGSDGNKGNPRDMMTSIIYGARISVTVGLLAAIMSVSIGLTLGLTAGYSGGATDEVIMRIADILIIIPTLPLFIVLAMILSPSVWNIVLILSVMGWMGFSRSVRSVTLSLRERAFVEAARAAGATKLRILVKHIFPNVIALVYLALAVTVPGAIVTEASLSFLGLYDPSLVTWGRVLNEFNASGVTILKGFGEYWFWVMPPGVGISLLAISFILMGYSLDEIFNPKFRERR